MKKSVVKSVEKEWFSIEEASRYLDSSHDYIYELVNSAKVSASRVGKKTWVDVKSLRVFLESNRI